MTEAQPTSSAPRRARTGSEPARPRRRFVSDRLLFATALVFFAGFLVRQIAVGAPLGWDEAIYAGGGRELVDGTASSGFGVHRPVAMKLVTAAALVAGSAEWHLRAVGLLVSLAFFLVYRVLGNRAAGPWPAAWAAAAMVTSFGLQRRGGEILSDVPSLVLLLLAAHIVIRALDRPAEGRPAAWLVAAAPVAAAAFYVRYGVTPAILGIAAAAAVVWWRPLAAGRGVALTAAALLLLLFFPHVVHSMHETGTPLGIIEASSEAARRAYVGDGLLHFPVVLAVEGGPVILILVLVGAIYGARRLRRPLPAERVVVFLWIASVVQIVLTGLAVHANFRFFFFGVAGLVLLGARATWEAVTQAGRPWHGPVAAIAIAAAALVTHEVNIERYRRLAEVRQVQVAAAALVERAAHGQPCAILTSEVPVVGWYARCEARRLATRPERLPPGRRFLVLFERDPQSAPTRAKLGRAHHLTEVGRAQDPRDLLGDASVYEIR